MVSVFAAERDDRARLRLWLRLLRTTRAIERELRERLDKATVGDLVRITGRIGQSKYKVDGHTQYSVDLIADGFAILAKAKVKTVEDDMEE